MLFFLLNFPELLMSNRQFNSEPQVAETQVAKTQVVETQVAETSPVYLQPVSLKLSEMITQMLLLEHTLAAKQK